MDFVLAQQLNIKTEEKSHKLVRMGVLTTE